MGTLLGLRRAGYLDGHGIVANVSRIERLRHGFKIGARELNMDCAPITITISAPMPTPSLPRYQRIVSFLSHNGR